VAKNEAGEVSRPPMDKEVCQRCRQHSECAWRTECPGLTPDDVYWQRGQVWCPRACLLVSTHAIPVVCPYATEHVVALGF